MVAQAQRVIPQAVAVNGFKKNTGAIGYSAPEDPLCIATHGWICPEPPISQGGAALPRPCPPCPEGFEWDRFRGECVPCAPQLVDDDEDTVPIDVEGAAAAAGLEASGADGYDRLAALMARALRIRRRG